MIEQTKPKPKPTIRTTRILNVLRPLANQPGKMWCMAVEELLYAELNIQAFNSSELSRAGYCTCCCTMEETTPRLTYVSGPTEVDKDRAGDVLAKAAWDYLSYGVGLGIAYSLGISRRYKNAYAKLEDY